MIINKEKRYNHISYSAKEIISLIAIFAVITTLILGQHRLTAATNAAAPSAAAPPIAAPPIAAPPVAAPSVASVPSVADPGTVQPNEPAVDSPNTIIRPFYDSNGSPPTAPGLAMKARAFEAEPSKIVYITIDDGPYPQSTPRLLDVLKEEDVKATFFDVGRQIEYFPSLLKAEYEQGHSIGNHTYSHDYSAIYKSPETFLADIQKNDDLIFKVIGIHPKIIRAPGGTLGFSIPYYNLLDANDYMAYDWNIDTNDTERKFSAKQLVDNVDKQIKNKTKIILLMHDLPNKSSSISALPVIIKHLKEKGYSFGTLSTNIMPITFPEGFYKE